MENKEKEFNFEKWFISKKTTRQKSQFGLLIWIKTTNKEEKEKKTLQKKSRQNSVTKPLPTDDVRC